MGPHTRVACKHMPRAGSHDNIVALRGLTHSENRFALVMEFCPRGTLDVLLHHTAFKRWEVRYAAL